MKKCKGCNTDKPEGEFGHYGRKNKCRQCCLDYFANYRKNNREKMKSIQKKYYDANSKEIYQREKEKKKKYRIENKEKVKAWRRSYALKNKEKFRKSREKWRKENPEKVKAYRKKNYKKNKKIWDERARLYRLQNREKVNSRQREYYRQNKEKFKVIRKRYYDKVGPISDPWSKLKRNICRRISSCIKDGYKSGSTEDALGYSMKELINHLESRFQPGMCWENYGKNGWHIDHIKPVSFYRIESVDDPLFKECWSLRNLRPMWARENMSKGDSMLEYQQLTGKLF